MNHLGIQVGAFGEKIVTISFKIVFEFGHKIFSEAHLFSKWRAT